MICVGLIVMALTVAAVAEDEYRGINVTGQAELSVPPDSVTIWLGVQAKGEEVPGLRQEVAAKTVQVRAVLARYGIEDTAVDASQLSIDSPGGGFDGFMPLDDADDDAPFGIKQVIKFTLRDLGQYDAIIDACIAAGANRIYKTEMNVDDLDGCRTRVIKDACADARRMAEQFARNFGVRVGKVTYLASGAVYVMRSPRDFEAMQGIFLNGPPVELRAFTPGLVYLRTTVKVRYELLAE